MPCAVEEHTSNDIRELKKEIQDLSQALCAVLRETLYDFQEAEDEDDFQPFLKRVERNSKCSLNLIKWFEEHSKRDEKDIRNTVDAIAAKVSSHQIELLIHELQNRLYLHRRLEDN